MIAAELANLKILFYFMYVPLVFLIKPKNIFIIKAP